MRKYETIYIVQPDLGEDDIKSLSDKVREVVSGMKGNCLRLEDWGTRRLAYPIRKQGRGRYFFLNCEGDSKLIAELERRLRLDDKVLRYQSVRLEKDLQVPAQVEEKPATEEAVTTVSEEPAATGVAEE